MLRSHLEDSNKFEKKELGQLDGTHTVFQYTDKSTSEDWIAKFNIKNEDPRYEVTTQEIYRLLIPNQPEYRFIIDEKTTQPIGVISSRVKGTQILEDNIYTVLSGDITNLATIQVAAYFTNDADLRWENLFVDSDSSGLKKIDGNWGFASLSCLSVFKSKITADHIDALPYAFYKKDSFYPSNWLPLIVTDPSKDPSSLFSKISSDEKYQNEKFAAILKILLLTPDFITQFVQAVQGSDELKLSDQLNKTRLDFEAAIQNNEYFKKYVEQFGETVKNQFNKDLERFKITDKQIATEETFKAINMNFTKLKKLCINKELESEEKQGEEKLEVKLNAMHEEHYLAEIHEEKVLQNNATQGDGEYNIIDFYKSNIEIMADKMIESSLFDLEIKNEIKKIVISALNEPFNKIAQIMGEIKRIIKKNSHSSQDQYDKEIKQFSAEIFAIILVSQWINDGNENAKILGTLDALILSANKSTVLFKEKHSDVFEFCQNIRNDQRLFVVREEVDALFI